MRVYRLWDHLFTPKGERTMRINRIISVFLTLTALLCLLLSACSGNRVVEIEFPQMVTMSYEDIPLQFDLSDEDIQLLGQELPLYKIVPRRNQDNAASYDSNLLDMFAGNIQETVEYERYTSYRYDNGDCLDIYENGSYSYRRGNYSDDILELSDDAVVQMAKEYLEQNGLLPDGFVAGETSGGTQNGDGTFLMKSVGFFQEIDGYRMDGRADVTVEVRADGISAVTSIYNDYAFDRNVPCLSYEDVQTLDPLEYGQIYYNYDKLSGAAERVVFREVEIKYYDSPVNQPELSHIQPVYQFKGEMFDTSGNSTEYYWTIPAMRQFVED